MSKLSNDTEKSAGIAALISGILLIILLFFHLFTFSQITGIGIAFIGIWLLLLSIDTYTYSRNESIVYLIISIISFVTGLSLYTHLNFNLFQESSWIYIAGIIIILTGLIALLGQGKAEKIAGITGMMLGTLFIVLYYYIANIYILVVITAIWLLTIGIIQSLITYDEAW